MVLVKQFEKPYLIEQVLKFFNYPNVRCNICGKWVENTEVPLHVTSKGGSYIHTLHWVVSEGGRKMVDNFAKADLTNTDD